MGVVDLLLLGCGLVRGITEMATSNINEVQIFGEESLTAERLFRRSIEDLTLSIGDPESLAQKLFSQEFIPQAVYQAAIAHANLPRERTRHLLDNVYDKIVLDPENLGKFLTLLRQLPASADLRLVRDRLKAEYGENTLHSLPCVKHKCVNILVSPCHYGVTV